MALAPMPLPRSARPGDNTPPAPPIVPASTPVAGGPISAPVESGGDNPNLFKIKRNVAKMVSMSAPESDIDAYIASEGVSLEELKATPVIAKLSGGKVTPMTEEQAAARQPSTNVYMDGKQVFKSGGVENATAGLNEVLYETVGGFADRAQNVINWGVAGANLLTAQKDLTTNMLRDNPIGGTEWISDQFERIGVNDPDKVIATNLVDRLSRMGGQGAGMAIGPEAVLGVLNKLGVVGPKAMELVGAVFGKAKSVRGMAGNAVAGAASGVGAQAAMEAAPEQLKPLAGVVGGLAGGVVGAAAAETPSLVREGARVAGDFVAPLTKSGRERLAGRELRDASTSPGHVIDDIESAPAEMVPGSKPTTFQQTGDMGLGALERGAAAKDPAPFMQRRADQNSARMGAFEDIQATGAPETVAKAVRSFLDDIDASTAAREAEATTAARNAAADLGPGATPDVAGDSLRNSLETARSAAKEQERALWSAVDPNGTLALGSNHTRAAASRIAGDIPKAAKPAEGEEALIFAAAEKLPEVAPFSELTALQSRLKTEMRAERIAKGESPTYRRLSQLNIALQDDIEQAIVAKVAEEQLAVAAGRMSIEETLAARLRAEQEAVRARQSAGQEFAVSIQGARPNGSSGTAAVHRPYAADGQGGRRPADAPGIDGLSGSVDSSALSRLNAARSATKARAETFDNNTLAPIRKRWGATAPYDMPASAVGPKLFFAGPKSFDAIQTYRKAVGDGPSLRALTEYAVDRLRLAAMRDDSTLDPSKLAAWRKSHSDALRAVPELDAKLANVSKASEAMADAAAARREAVDEAQAGSLGKIMGVDDPQDVTRTVGATFGRRDAVSEMKRLTKAVQAYPEAKEGLRKAVVDHMIDRFVSNTEAGSSGLGSIKSDQFQSFVAQNKATLRAAGFSEAEIGTMEALAADLQRANRSAASLKLPGGSNTTQDVLAAGANESGGTTLVKIILASAASGGGVGLFGGPLVGGAALIGTALAGVLRQRGLRKVDDLVREALLDPSLARQLMLKGKPSGAALSDISFGQRAVRAVPTTGVVLSLNSEDEGNSLKRHNQRTSGNTLSLGEASPAKRGLSLRPRASGIR